MLNRSGPAFVALLALAAAFLYGVLHLFALRFAEGGVYPPYSTLRADPVGAKAIHDALGVLPGVEVTRNFRPLPRLETKAPITLVYAGVDWASFWEPRERERFEEIVRGGAHAIFAFAPIDRPPQAYEAKRNEDLQRARKEQARQEEKKGKKDAKKDGKKKRPEDEDLEKFAAVAREWGCTMSWLPPPPTRAYQRTAQAAAGQPLEPEVSWHSALAFTALSPEWQTLYTSAGQAVAIERPLGRGRLVFLGDAYLLSNEALRAERSTRLLGHLFGGPPTIVFDEEHHGVREQPGIAALARKYRLHSAVLALAVLSALFIWKCTARFLPPREESAVRDGVVTGKEAAEGFVHLLRRSLPPDAVLAACVEEWRKTSRHSARDRARLEETWATEMARPARERQPVAAYRLLARALARPPGKPLSPPNSA